MAGNNRNTDRGIESEQLTADHGWSLLRAGSAVRLWTVLAVGLVAVLLLSGVAMAADGPVDIDPDEDLTGEGTEASPYIINNASELQSMQGNLTAHYELGGAINATNTSEWNDGDGFYPIGNHTGGSSASFDGDPFEGSLDGNGYAIENLTINRGGESYIGLFGKTTGSTKIGNLTLTNATVTGAGHVGALVGEAHGEVYKTTVGGTVTTELSGNSPNSDNGARTGGVVGMLEESGTVTNTTASVNVTGTGSRALRIGGLVGYSFGEIRDSKATGDVEGDNGIGGIIGRNIGLIENVAATGNVTGSASAIGGIAGFNGPVSGGHVDVTITRSHATGTVSAPAAAQVGGLVGNNGRIVSKSYATGDVKGDDRVGGLVARNSASESHVDESYATGTVEGNHRVGGFIGYLQHGTVRNSYANGTVSDGDTDVGGFVGENRDTVETSYAVVDVPAGKNGFAGANNGNDITTGYWDTDATGVTVSDGGVGLSTFEMTGLVAKDYTDFDYDNTWNATQLYPRLAWESVDEPDPYPTATPGEGEVWLLNDSDNGYYHNYSLDGNDVRWLGDVVASLGADDTAQIIEIVAGNATADYDTIVVGEGEYRLDEHEVDLTADGAGNLVRLFSHSGSDHTEILRVEDAGFAAYQEALFRVDNAAASDLIIGDAGSSTIDGDGGFYIESHNNGGTLSPLIGVYNTADQFNLTVSNTTFGMWTNHGDTIILDDDNAAFNLELDVVSHSGALINASAASSLSVTNSTIVEENDPRGNGLDGEGISFLKLEASGLDRVTIENVIIDGATEDSNVGGVIDVIDLHTDASVTMADLRLESTSVAAINATTEFDSLALSELNLTDIGARGITVEENIRSVSIADSEITDTLTASIYADATFSQFDITNTTITDGNTAGIYLGGVIGNSTIADNTLNNTANSALEFNVNAVPTTPFEISNNYINGTGSGNSIIVIREHGQTNITDNTLLNSGLRGIYLDAADSVIETNYIENSSDGQGIHLAGNADRSRVVDTTVIDSAGLGIHVEDATDVTIYNATVDTTGSHGIEFTNGASGGELIESTIRNATNHALTVGTSMVSVTELTLLSATVSADVTDALLNVSTAGPAGPGDYQAGGDAINVSLGGVGQLDNFAVSYNTSAFAIDPGALAVWRYNSTGWHREQSTVDTGTQTVATTETITSGEILTSFASNVSVSADDTTVNAGSAGTIAVNATNTSGTPLESVELSVTDDGGLGGLTVGDIVLTDANGVASFGFQESNTGSYTSKFSWTNDTTVNDTATVTVQSTGGGSSSSGSGGSPSAQPTTGVTVDQGDGDDQTDAPDANRPDTRVSITNPVPGQTLVIEGDRAFIAGDDKDDETGSADDSESETDDGISNVRSDRLSIEINTDRDFELSVTTYETDLTRGVGTQQGAQRVQASDTVRSAAASFEAETLSVSAGYINVEHTLEPGEISGATFEFSIRQSYLDSLGVEAEDVLLHHGVDAGWETRETNRIDADGTHSRFTSSVPGFSVFALGTGAAQFEVTDVSLESETIVEGETAAVTATVENRGQQPGEYTVELAANGETVDSETFEIEGGSSTNVQLSFVPEPGVSELEINGIGAGTVTVERSDDVDETGGDADETDEGWGLSWLLVIGGVGVLSFIIWRRHDIGIDKQSS